MPLYLILSDKELTEDKKKKIVTTVTQTHCEVTKAPSEFCTVTFAEGMPLKNKRRITILANIRIGGYRTDAQIKKLGDEMILNVAKTHDVDPERVSLDFVGVEAHWIFEGGDVLPDPGYEEAWLEKHANHS